MNSTPKSPTTAHVTTRAERALAVEHWLLQAAPDVPTARREWEATGMALLRCGGLFTAVRIPGAIVRAAAGTDEPPRVDVFLTEVLHGGPVFTVAGLDRYYALVGAAALCDWDASGTERLPRGIRLGVPAVSLTEYVPGVGYWAVPMDSPAELCMAADLADMIAHGRARLAAATQREPSERGTAS